MVSVRGARPWLVPFHLGGQAGGKPTKPRCQTDANDPNTVTRLFQLKRIRQRGFIPPEDPEPGEIADRLDQLWQQMQVQRLL